jgi:hypothetical protein
MWPKCLTEEETLQKMLDGSSISRFGDGELGIAQGGDTETHAPNAKLAKELRTILVKPAPKCLPAIPTMHEGPRQAKWIKRADKWSPLFDMNRVYGSAFVGQSISAPWILNDDYIRKFRSLWSGKRVGMVSHNVEALTKLVRRDDCEIVPILCPERESYSDIDLTEASCLDADVDLVLICAGPMATALANRLSPHVQAIDFGRGLGVVLRYQYEG